MDLSRMRAGDYPAPPEAWQQAAGLGDLRYGVQARRYEYMNTQCRYCGHSCSGRGPVGAHSRVTCLACGTPQCDRDSGKCLVCMVGWLRTSFWMARGTRSACGYAGCEGQAVADAPRVRQVCLGCLARPKSRGQTLADEIANYLRLRDRGGQGHWQRIAWFGPPKRYYVRRVHEGGREGWEGRPYDTAGQADRGAECWNDPKVTDGGWRAERVEATPEVRQLVDAWQAEADRRHGRTAQARSRSEAS